MAIEKVTTTNGVTTAVDTGQILGKDDFLKLLVTELKYQNPMAPADNKQFISQMAEFSSLEQMQNMNSNLENLTSLQNLSQVNFAANLISHRVVGSKTDGTPVDGVVSNVSFENSEPCVVVDGSTINLKNIIKIF